MITPNHSVLSITAEPCPLKQGYCLPGKSNIHCVDCPFKKTYTPEMIPSGALYSTKWKSNYTESKLFLLMPIMNKTEDKTTINISDYIKRNIIESEGYIQPMTMVQDYDTKTRFGQGKQKIRNGRAKGYKQIKGTPIKNTILIDKDFLKLAGFYLAEGSVTYQKRGGYIMFSFGKHEQKYVDEVKQLLYNLFSVHAKVREKQTALSIEVYSDILAQFFEELFSKGALHKKIPQWMLSLPVEKQKYLVEG
jgi:hypothetical protein